MFGPGTNERLVFFSFLFSISIFDFDFRFCLDTPSLYDVQEPVELTDVENTHPEEGTMRAMRSLHTESGTKKVGDKIG